VDRCLVAGRILWFYGGKLVWPWPLMFFYPRWVIDSHQGWQYLFPLAAMGVAVALWFTRHRIGRGPLVAVLFFGGTLVPALGFFNVYPMRFSFVADHFQYLASIGLIVLVVAGVSEAFSRLGSGARPVAVVAAGCLLLSLGALTGMQTRMYGGLETLWRETIARNPGAWLAHNNLAPLLVLQGKLDEAIACSTEALRLRNDYVEAYNNRGIAHDRKGDQDLAIRDYAKAIELKPDYADAYYNRGNAHSAKGNHVQAEQDFTRAIELKSDFVQAYNNRALSNFRLKRYDQAWADVRRLRALGYQPHPSLIEKLVEMTGRSE
jgi:tetratricopeptide (TPR) repeat protein